MVISTSADKYIFEALALGQVAQQNLLTFKSTCPTIKTIHSGKNNKNVIYIYRHYVCFVFPFNKEQGNLIVKLQVKTVLNPPGDRL